MCKYSSRKNRLAVMSGFTLIELLVVIAIMGLALSLVGPLAMSQLDKFRAKDEVVQLERAVRSAKQNAYLNEASTVLSFDGNRLEVVSEVGPSKSYIFNFLSFNPSENDINRNGFMVPTAITYKIRGEQAVLAIPNEGVIND